MSNSDNVTTSRPARPADAGSDLTGPDADGDVPEGPAERQRARGVTPRKAAMDLLARREHSRAELERKLAGRFPRQDVVEAVERLAHDGLQSDLRFARSFSRERILRGYGPRRIAAELRQRGVARRLVEVALAEACEEEGVTWTSLAQAALERKFGAGEPADVRERARRARFLYQRGFSTEGIDTLD